MSKKVNPSQNPNQMSNADFKRMIKRMWICLACIAPAILLLTALFASVGMPVWLAMLLNVIIGGLICLLVYIIFDKIERKKRIQKLLEPEKDDPFSD